MANIILLHGALGSSGDLNALSKVLIRRGLSVSSFSFSGHGKTSLGPAYGIEQFALELEHHILENSLKNSSVFGYSMGGFVALYLASKQKKIIKSIVTLGTKFNWSKDAVERELKMLNPELILAKVPSFAKTLEIKTLLRMENSCASYSQHDERA